jgi:uncharacterized protein
VRLKDKAIALLEVVVVIFACVPLLTLGVYRFFPKFESWQTDAIGFPFPVFVHVAMIMISLLAIALRRKKPADYGISFTNIKFHLDIAGTCFIPVVLASIPFGFGVDYRSWDGALILAALQIGLLFFLALTLRKKPSAPNLGIMATGMLLLLPACGTLFGKSLVIFSTYAIFVGFGEEIIYRGYTQTRLNEAFGKPYQFFGVAFGWGAIITALLFGLTHVGILGWFLGISGKITWAWGFWTFFGGLVFSYIREKSGGILAPALLHGLPQAIASVALLFFS